MQRSTKRQALEALHSRLAPANTAQSFVLNVIFTHHGGKAAYVVGLMRLLELGHSVSCAQFDIDKLVVDGFTVAWADLENAERLSRRLKGQS